ncbi:hypothetical protein LJB92_00030 [Bacteroidales bacterium OttesenSCG-928-M06]|nr:hypothetical protein [Bacteroidales bacterium OttesenSCG-928-M06]
MMTRDFGMGFFGRSPFCNEERKKNREEWAQMTDEQKLEFMNKRMEAMDRPDDHFSVEAIDARCEKWIKMSSEEKEAFVKERKEAFKHKMEHFHKFRHHMHH